MEEVGPAFIGVALKGDIFKQFSNAVAKCLAVSLHANTGRHLDYSLCDLAGLVLTREALSTAAWRLAGNEKSLIAGAVVNPWQFQASYELVTAQITKCKMKMGGRHCGQIGHELAFRVLHGSPCPLEIYQWWSMRKCYYLALRKDEAHQGFGFTRTRLKPRMNEEVFPFQHPRELVGLRCLLVLEPDLSTDTAPGFHTITFTSTICNYNKELLRYRARVLPKYKCPYDFDIACFSCPIGQDKCRAGTHRMTYVYKKCSHCGEDDCPHDPEDTFHDYCIDCVEGEILHKDEES